MLVKNGGSGSNHGSNRTDALTSKLQSQAGRVALLCPQTSLYRGSQHKVLLSWLILPGIALTWAFQKARLLVDPRRSEADKRAYENISSLKNNQKKKNHISIPHMYPRDDRV